MADNKIAILVERLKQLKDDYNKGQAALVDKAKKAEIDPGALQRLAAWCPEKQLLRLEQEALDDQYRFLAGLRTSPAELPAEGKLATAAALYAQGLSVRKVAKKMGISIGSAHTLKVKAAAFTVQPSVNMNTAPEEAPPSAATGSGEAPALKVEAAVFTVQPPVNMNTAPEEAQAPAATDSGESEAQVLDTKAAAFTVQPQVNMNATPEEPHQSGTTGRGEAGSLAQASPPPADDANSMSELPARLRKARS